MRCLAISAALALLFLASTVRANDAAAADRDAIVARLLQFQHFTAEFDRTTQHNPDPNLRTPAWAVGRLGQIEPRIESFHERVTLSAGQLLFWSEASKADCDAAIQANRPMSRTEALVVTPGRCESMVWPLGSKHALGGIMNKRDVPSTMAIDVALGLRLEELPRWLTANDMNTAQLLPGEDADHVILRHHDEYGRQHSFSYSKRLGYAVDHYRVDYTRPGSVLEYVCSDFRQIGNLWLPFTIDRQSTGIDSSGQRRHPITSSLHVQRYVLDDPAKRKGSLGLPWPKGTMIRNERRNFVVEVETDGEPLTDVQLLEMHRKQEKR